MLSRLASRRLASAVSRQPCQRAIAQRRWNTPAPKLGDGPLMSRRADRELPELKEVQGRWGKTLPAFLLAVAACSIAIFNYQKSSSPVVAGTLYALRTSPKARAVLGDEIYFKSQIPWISGEMNQMHGSIDITFAVRGSKSVATMRFTSRRATSKGMFETSEWSLTTEDGQYVDLLEGNDPFKSMLADDDAMPEVDDEHSTRGFRQQGAYNR